MKSTIELLTFDGKKINVKIKHITSLNLNGITVKATYKKWLITGEFKDKDYLLSPESLLILVEQIDNSKHKNQLNTKSSKIFLEYHPTLDSLKKSLEERDKLPKLG